MTRSHHKRSPHRRSHRKSHSRSGRGSATRGWHNEKPGYHERTVMLARCGHKCFLGPGKSFPICKKGTCTVSQHGVHAAYGRAREWKHGSVAKRARKMMK